jgi:hypothetical protein
VWPVWFHLTHTVPRRAPHEAACEGREPCFVLAGSPWTGIDDPGDGAGLDGLLVTSDPWREEGSASACTVIEDHTSWALFDCHGGAPAPGP